MTTRMATRFSCSVLFRPSILVCITSKSLVQIFIKMPMARIISGMTTSSTTASRGLMEMLIPRAAMSITGARTSIRRPIFNIMVMALTSLVMRVMREAEEKRSMSAALAQVGAEALAGKGGVFGGEHAEGHGQQGEGQHDRSQPEDIGRIPGGDGDVHDLCHDQWQDQFADDLQGDKDRGAHCLPLIALEMGDE